MRARLKKTQAARRKIADAVLGFATPQRAAHAHEMAQEPTDVAGVKHDRVRQVVDTLHARGALSDRQYTAAGMLRDDAEVEVGAKPPSDMTPGGGRVLALIGPNDFMMMAAKNVLAAKKAVDAMGGDWWRLGRVVVQGEAPLAAGLSRETLRLMLDAVGDAYDLPAGWLSLEVLWQGKPVLMRACEGDDGMWRARQLGKIPWAYEAKGCWALITGAKEELARRALATPPSPSAGNRGLT